MFLELALKVSQMLLDIFHNLDPLEVGDGDCSRLTQVGDHADASLVFFVHLLCSPRHIQKVGVVERSAFLVLGHFEHPCHLRLGHLPRLLVEFDLARLLQVVFHLWLVQVQ